MLRQMNTPKWQQDIREVTQSTFVGATLLLQFLEATKWFIDNGIPKCIYSKMGSKST